MQHPEPRRVPGPRSPRTRVPAMASARSISGHGASIFVPGGKLRPGRRRRRRRLDVTGRAVPPLGVRVLGLGDPGRTGSVRPRMPRGGEREGRDVSARRGPAHHRNSSRIRTLVPGFFFFLEILKVFLFQLGAASGG